jgi:tetratricopeptide (TPR) repeat protein
VVDLAVQLDHHRRLPRIHTAIGLYDLCVREDLPGALEHLQPVCEMAADARHDPSTYMPVWFAVYYLGGWHSWDGRFDQAQSYLELSLELSESVGDQAAIAYANGGLSHFYALKGDLRSADRAATQSLRISKEIGVRSVQGMGHTARGFTSYLIGSLDAAERELLTGLEYCQETAQFVWGQFAQFYLGNLYRDTGKYGAALDHFETGAEALVRVKALPSFVHVFEAAAARVKVLSGEKEVDLDPIIEGIHDNKLAVFRCWSARLIGETLADVGGHHLGDAKAWLDRAIEIDTANDMTWFLARDHSAAAELLIRTGDRTGAEESLTTAVNLYRRCGADWWASRTQKRLTEIS